MKRLNLPLFLDTLFASICAFLLFFTAIRFYTKNAIIGLIFGICGGILFGMLAFLYISNKQNKTLLLSRDEKAKKLLALHLSLSRDDYISKLFKGCFENAKICGKRVICGGVSYFFNFKMQPLGEDDVAKVIKFRYDGEKKIYCVKASPEAVMLASNFSIETVGIDQVYAELKKKKSFARKIRLRRGKKTELFQKNKTAFFKKTLRPPLLVGSGAFGIKLLYFLSNLLHCKRKHNAYTFGCRAGF